MQILPPPKLKALIASPDKFAWLRRLGLDPKQFVAFLRYGGPAVLGLRTKSIQVLGHLPSQKACKSSGRKIARFNS